MFERVETEKESIDYLIENGLILDNQRWNKLFGLKSYTFTHFVTMYEIDIDFLRERFEEEISVLGFKDNNDIYMFLDSGVSNLFISEQETFLFMLRNYPKEKFNTIVPRYYIRRYKNLIDSYLDEFDVQVYDNIMLALTLDAPDGTFLNIVRESLIERGADIEQATVTHNDL